MPSKSLIKDNYYDKLISNKLKSRIIFVNNLNANKIIETYPDTTPPWAGRSYTIEGQVFESSLYNRWKNNVYDSPLIDILPNGVFVKATYQFSMDGTRMLRHLGTSPISIDSIKQDFKNNPIVIFNIKNNKELIPLPNYENNEVYYGERLVPYPDGVVNQPYYRHPGHYFSDDFNTLYYREDDYAHYKKDFGLEFYYKTEKTTSNLVKLTDEFDKWIIDPAVYITKDGNGKSVNLHYDKDFTDKTPSVEELAKRENLSYLSVAQNPNSNQEKYNYGSKEKPQLP